MVFQVAESSQHSLIQVHQVLANLLLTVLGRVLELHAAKLVQDTAHVLTNDCPRDLVLALSGRLDSASGSVIETDEVLKHEYGLVEWTITIVGCVAVLLQVIVLDELGNFKSDLVGLGEGVLKKEHNQRFLQTTMTKKGEFQVS